MSLGALFASACTSANQPLPETSTSAPPPEPVVRRYAPATFTSQGAETREGPELPRRGLPYPRSKSGVAIDAGDRTVAVGADGTVYGYFKGIYVDELSTTTSGPVLLRTTEDPNANFSFYAEVFNLVPFPDVELALASGALVEQTSAGQSNMVHKSGGILWNFRAGRCCVEIASGRDIVSAILDGAVASYDVRARSRC